MRSSNEIVDLMMEVLRDKEISISELARRVDMAKSGVSRYFNKTRQFPLNRINDFAKALEVDPSYLLGVNEYENIDTNNITDFYNYKLFPCSVSAGALEDIEGTSEYELVSLSDKILGKYSRSTDIILLKVNGDSMNKIIPNRSLIIIDTSKKNVNDIQDGDIVVFSHEGEYSVKRFFNDKDNKRLLFKPESTNELFTAIEFKYENAFNLKLIGKVVKYIVDLD